MTTPHNETFYIQEGRKSTNKYKLYKAYQEKLHVTMQSGLIIDSSGTTKIFYLNALMFKKMTNTWTHFNVYIKTQTNDFLIFTLVLDEESSNDVKKWTILYDSYVHVITTLFKI